MPKQNLKVLCVFQQKLINIRIFLYTLIIEKIKKIMYKSEEGVANAIK